MESRALALVFSVLCLSVLRASHATTAGTADGNERWGYVEVRPSKSDTATNSASWFLSADAFISLFSSNCSCYRCRGSRVLVVLQESQQGFDADETMADHPVAAGWTGTYLFFLLNLKPALRELGHALTLRK
jgi:hypothetical protein